MSSSKEHAPSSTWLALLSAIVALFGAHVGRAWDFTVDDAGISFSYARNLARGYGLVLTPGAERVEAATNFLWVLLLAPAEWIGLTHEALSKILGVAFGAGALVAIAFFPAAAYARRPRFFDLVAPTVAASFAHVALWTASGLENGLFSFLAALSVTLHAWEEHDDTRSPWSACTLSLLFATRPDGALYAVAIAGAKVLRALTGRFRRQDVLWAFGLAVGVGALELFRLAYFAWPVPNSFYTKQRTFEFGKDLTDFKSAGWSYVAQWIERYKLKRVLMVSPALLFALRAPSARIGLLFATVAGLFFPVYSHGDWMEEWRFLTFPVPLICLSMAEAVRALVRLPLTPFPPVVRRGVGAVLAAAAAVAFVHETTQAYSERFAAIRTHSTLEFAPVRARARYYAAASKALDLYEASVLDPDVGGTSYDSGLAVVDLYGLGDTAIAHTHNHDEPGLREAIFNERRPSIVHLHGAWYAAVVLDRLEELEQLYIPLPSLIQTETETGSNSVRREAIAAPWVEESERAALLPPGSTWWIDGHTVSAAGIEPMQRVTVELAIANAPNFSAAEVIAVPQGAGRPVTLPVRIAGDLVPGTSFLTGERPTVRLHVTLPAGHYELRFHGDALDTRLAEVHVAPGAASRDIYNERVRIDTALRAGQLREARRVALRLLLRRRDGDDTHAIDSALARYAAPIAERAARLADQGVFGVANDMAREAQRFANANPDVRSSLQRVVECMADASRHAERRGDIANAFTLARDAVLLDPRRSWMRRRAELLRMRRRSEYDGGRDLAAYRTAAAALSGTRGVASPHYDAALALLGATGRWREAAALADRVGTEPTTPWSRLALARGRLARGDVGGAVALARQVPCHEARDPELVRALRVLTGAPLRPGDAVCESARGASSDTPWLGRAEGPFDAEEGSFEGGRFGRWTVLGTAFGTVPVRAKAKDQTFVNGWRGQYFASSYARNSDTQMGMLRSRPFTISTDAISFLAGGGNEIERVGVRLIVDGQAVARSTGSGHEGLRRMWWDVRPWRGRNAVIEVYDSHAEGWGHIMVDDFVAEPAMPADVVTLPVVAPTQ